VFTYTRSGSSVLALGITSRQAEISAMGLSNNAPRIYDDNLFD